MTGARPAKMLFAAAPHGLGDEAGNDGILVSLLERPGSFPVCPTGNSETPQISAQLSPAYPRGAETISEFPSPGRVSQGNVHAREFTVSRHWEPRQVDARAELPLRVKFPSIQHARARVLNPLTSFWGKAEFLYFGILSTCWEAQGLESSPLVPIREGELHVC